MSTEPRYVINVMPSANVKRLVFWEVWEDFTCVAHGETETREGGHIQARNAILRLNGITTN